MQTNTVKHSAHPESRPTLAAVQVQKETISTVESKPAESVVSPISDKPNQSVYYVNRSGKHCPDKLTPEIAEEFKAALTSHMAELSQQYGVALNKLSIELSDDAQNLDIVLKASTINFHGMDRYSIEYLKSAGQRGFKPEWIGKTFSYKASNKMVLTGYDSETNRIRVFTGSTAVWIREESFNHLIELLTFNDLFENA